MVGMIEGKQIIGLINKDINSNELFNYFKR